ncbi:MAG: UvrD-helicase domain-containing protein [Parcubacteria group bacterium]|nr:UvrD-helicase domain-containing protein [Parcubacteria group bacterium]
MQNLLSELNERQAQAVQATDGPVLVIAGAGSGKTKTLTHRIAYLVTEKGIKPHQILAVTFTNKAADEMRNRAAKLLGAKPNQWKTWQGFGSGPALGTFHAICVRILRQEAGRVGFKREFAIYDTDEQKSAIKKVMYNEGVSPKDVNPNAVLNIISRAKNELLTPSKFANQTDGPFEEIVAGLYENYQEYLKENQAMDFDDLLFNAVTLFKKHPEVLTSYQKRWPYIMIDEYQDTNQSQYEWARLLAGKTKNIFVVGDDWQGIYSWRGANIRNILEFEKDYKGAQTILLEQNYRSTAPIVALGNAIISGNASRMKKKLWTDREKGATPEVWQVENESREAEKVLEKVCELEGLAAPAQKLPDQEEEEVTYDYAAEGNGSGILDQIMKGFKAGKRTYRSGDMRLQPSKIIPFDLGTRKLAWNDYVVLYRTNAQSRVLEEAMLRYGVPYRLVGGIRFYDRKEVKDTLAYLKFLLNPNDVLALERIINEPVRGIGNKTLGTVYTQARSEGKDIVACVLESESIEGLALSRLEAFKAFADVFSRGQESLPEMTVAEAIDFLLKRSGYIDALKALGNDGNDKLENVAELKSVAKKFASLKGSEGVQAFLEDVALVSDQDTFDPESGQAITLMTLHSAKGLEFKNVFLVGMEEGLLPHANSMIDPQQLEEERRLCYVGITRAKDRLFMLLARSRTIYGSVSITTPSRFIAELGDEHVEFFEDGES